MIRDFFLGFIRVHVLYHASVEPVYGAALIEELSRHGYSLSPGTLYPILLRMEKEGYLQAQKRVVSGKARRYYTITDKGTRALVEAKAKVKEFVLEVLEGG